MHIDIYIHIYTCICNIYIFHIYAISFLAICFSYHSRLGLILKGDSISQTAQISSVILRKFCHPYLKRNKLV